MIKFFEKNLVKRTGVSLGYPLIGFWLYWKAFDGNYAGTDVFWGASVSVAFALAIYLYFPLGKRVERGSKTWFLGLLAIICLFVVAIILIENWTTTTTVSDKAWNQYILYTSIFLPIIHVLARNQDKPLFGRLWKTSIER